jgi:hypothetical protein
VDHFAVLVNSANDHKRFPCVRIFSFCDGQHGRVALSMCFKGVPLAEFRPI